MDNPLVSIIVPVYNVETYLSQCLDSLQNQSYTNIEVIVIDDGSKDNSWSVLQKYVVDKRFCCISQNNQGVSKARNKGLGLAKGEYIMFVDADDWLDCDAVTKCVTAMQESNSDVCLFDYMREFAIEQDSRLFNAVIRASVTVADAPGLGKTLFDYRPESTASQDYEKFIEEVIIRRQSNRFGKSGKEAERTEI